MMALCILAGVVEKTYDNYNVLLLDAQSVPSNFQIEAHDRGIYLRRVYHRRVDLADDFKSMHRIERFLP